MGSRTLYMMGREYCTEGGGQKPSRLPKNAWPSTRHGSLHYAREWFISSRGNTSWRFAIWFEQSSCSPTAALRTTVSDWSWSALAGRGRRRRSTDALPIWASKEQTSKSSAWNPLAPAFRSGKGRLSLALRENSD